MKKTICLLITIPPVLPLMIFLFGPLLWFEIFFEACLDIVVDSVDRSFLYKYIKNFNYLYIFYLVIYKAIPQVSLNSSIIPVDISSRRFSQPLSWILSMIWSKS